MISGLLLYMVARLLGARVTSFFRSPELNASVGGKPNSYHLKAGAIDVGLETSADTLNVFRSLGFRVVVESDHVHVQSSEELEARLVGALSVVFLCAVLAQMLKE